ncbi:MAG TPA: IPT/TIG domain-containing protein [Solirubrobacteraceae bacterium]|nr:IPT/TIG domain-containing protein [Solirubrobacteraceae bacterium]
MRVALHETDRPSIRAPLLAAGCVLVALGSCSAFPARAAAGVEPGVLMGAEQKANWEDNSAPCPKSHDSYCADEISQAQFVGWPFIAEHTGTVEAIFAALATGEATGAEVGIFANRRYHYAEIEYRGEEENGAKETWTPARFKQYEFEIPPEDPGALLGTSGKVPESKILDNGWTEFKLETPVKVVKGEKYWLTNTTFQKAYGTGSEEFHKYQLFYHERVSTTEDQPWGNYTNEPHNWEHVARTLKELPSPETTKINCEKCNTEGWLQEEPKGFDLLNTNRGAQEEGGQTYSYAYGTIEEDAGEEVPTVVTGVAGEITQTTATLNGTVDPNGSEVTECVFEYGPGVSYGYSAPCTPAPGSGDGPVSVTAALTALTPGSTYHYRVKARNAHGTASGNGATFQTEAPPVVTRLSARKGPAAGGTVVQITGTGFGSVTEVRFGGLPASFEMVSPTTINAVSPAATTGAVEVTVITPSGDSGANRRARFTYERPTVTHITPAAGPVGGGTEATVTGSGFSTATGGTTFKVGKGTAVTLQCPSTLECTIRTPSAVRPGVGYVFATAGGRKSHKAAAVQFDYESAGAVMRRLRPLTRVAPVAIVR